ncbi:MAG: universal stress protein [Minicystis sp.]
MTIVCGTDFSEHAARAARDAGAIARRLGVPLVLVHVIDELGATLAEGGARDEVFDPQRAALHRQADEIRALMNIAVEPILREGAADQQIVEVARTAGARLLVLGALGVAEQRRWLLGSAAERAAQASPVPVLVVREGFSLETWTRGERPLRVMVGVDSTPTSKVALRWAEGLREMGRCEMIVAQIAWPPEEHRRLGIPGPLPLDHLDAKIHEVLERELRSWAGDLRDQGDTSFLVGPGWGRVDTHLALLAAEAKADLLVVGKHRRAGLARLWLGSVSRGVLHQASMNVACVPRGEVAEDEQGIPTFRTILAPTDFSALANRAVLVAYGLAAPGGVVHLLHVVTREPGLGEQDLAERLRALVPQGVAARGVATEIEIVHERAPGRASGTPPADSVSTPSAWPRTVGPVPPACCSDCRRGRSSSAPDSRCSWCPRRSGNSDRGILRREPDAVSPPGWPCGVCCSWSSAAAAHAPPRP